MFEMSRPAGRNHLYRTLMNLEKSARVGMMAMEKATRELKAREIFLYHSRKSVVR